ARLRSTDGGGKREGDRRAAAGGAAGDGDGRERPAADAGGGGDGPDRHPQPLHAQPGRDRRPERPRPRRRAAGRVLPAADPGGGLAAGTPAVGRTWCWTWERVRGYNRREPGSHTDGRVTWAPNASPPSSTACATASSSGRNRWTNWAGCPRP